MSLYAYKTLKTSTLNRVKREVEWIVLKIRTTVFLDGRYAAFKNGKTQSVRVSITVGALYSTYSYSVCFFQLCPDVFHDYHLQVIEEKWVDDKPLLLTLVGGDDFMNIVGDPLFELCQHHIQMSPNPSDDFWIAVNEESYFSIATDKVFTLYMHLKNEDNRYLEPFNLISLHTAKTNWSCDSIASNHHNPMMSLSSVGFKLINGKRVDDVHFRMAILWFLSIKKLPVELLRMMFNMYI